LPETRRHLVGLAECCAAHKLLGTIILNSGLEPHFSGRKTQRG